MCGNFNIREVRDKSNRVDLQRPWTLHALSPAPLKYRIYVGHVSRIAHVKKFEEGRVAGDFKVSTYKLKIYKKNSNWKL